MTTEPVEPAKDPGSAHELPAEAAPAGAGEIAPERLYAQRLTERRAELDHWSTLDRRLQVVRLAVFAIGVGLAFAVVGADALGYAWLAPPALLFVILLFWHDRVLRRRDGAERAVGFYERGVARLEYRFAGQGCSGLEYLPDTHPYARDLDLFGEGSLFERLCLARTRGGEETLAGWLLAPAPAETIRARQAAVEELRPRVGLREELGLVGDDVRAGLRPEILRAWGEAPAVGFRRTHRLVARLLATLSTSTLLAWILGVGAPVMPAAFALFVGLQIGFALHLRARVAATVKAVDGPTRELDLIAQLLERIEREPGTSAPLVALQARLRSDGPPPSVQIARLHKRVELLDARRNAFFAPLGALLLWTTQLAIEIERWRGVCGPHLGDWIDGISEFEALTSLAGFAFENPHHRFPALAEEGPRFAARGLGHSLLPPDRCVTNDVRLDADPQVLIVSGSNMSGKSTLLRSVGVAAVLAQAGAPVYADAMRLSSLSIGASLHVLDSLQEGTSHFYAEIMRVRQVVEIADEGLPLLFLLDEIFHGTNSHDRGIGAQAIVTALLERRAIGLVTTHDLALTRIADDAPGRVRNVHFEDQIEDGRIVFDYRMRKGVVTKSNAVALMRSVGLPV